MNNLKKKCMCIAPCLNCVNSSAIYFTKSEFALCQCTFKNILLTKFLKQIISRKEYIMCNFHLIEWILVVYCHIKITSKLSSLKQQILILSQLVRVRNLGSLAGASGGRPLMRLQTSCWLGCSYEKPQPVGRGSTFKLILLAVSSLL